MSPTTSLCGSYRPSRSKLSFLSIFVYFAVILHPPAEVNGDRTFTKVYEPILGSLACFKRLNGTHEIGCRSSAKGDVGVLHLIDDSKSLQWILKDGPHAPYIAMMYPDTFTRDNLMQFQSSGRVSGVLLMKEKEKDSSANPPSFSPDSTCPNNAYGVFWNKTSDEDYCRKWNEHGSSLLFENFDFPIFLVRNETQAGKLLDCYDTFNKPKNDTPRDWPLCAGQLKSFMMAARDTPTCIRRSSVISISPGSTKVCDPLGDQNLWGTILPQNRTQNQTQSAVVIATRFDGASLFDEISPAADTAVTGLVTFLTVIKQLSLVRDNLTLSPDSPISNVYFMLFNGESFGYIGSSRIVYDMKRGQFPLSLEEIKYYIEINQAALKGSNSESYFIHQSEVSQSKELTETLESEAALQSLTMTTVPDSAASTSWGVPPSSLHSFLRERPDLTGVVITNHRQSYRNQYYNSIFDSKESLEYHHGDESVFSLQQKIASLAATISNSIISLMEIPDAPKISPDLETVDDLLFCYLESSNCTIFQELSGYTPAPGAPIDPYPLYVGVATHGNTLTHITRLLLISYLGTRFENITKEEECWEQEGSGPYYFFKGSCWTCPEMNMTEAKSPAFLIPDYDWSSGKYSTWTESVWQSFSVKIFLKPSLLHEIVTLVSGIIVLVVSMGVMYFVNAKADLIFPSRTDAMVC